MHDLTASFDAVAWETPQPGVREKKIVIGVRIIRILELTDELFHPDWCWKGHTGFVIDGSFVLNINGSERILNQSDVFFVDEGNPEHRHIPVVESGGHVTLLLIEEKE